MLSGKNTLACDSRWTRAMRSSFALGVMAMLVFGCGDDAAAPAGTEDAATDGAGGAGTDAGTDAGASRAGNAGRPAGVATCYSALADAHPATTAFWAAFLGGKLEDRADAIAGLEAAGQEYPDEEEFALLAGLANLWRVAEPLPDQVDDLPGMITGALNSRTQLERAYELCPTDHRIPAWLGPVLVRTGEATGNQAAIDEGLEVLQQGIDHYAEFVLFSKMLIYADRPKDDADFQKALDAILENLDICPPDSPACTNQPLAAHNFEGASVFFGDVLAKAGMQSEARATYTMAMDVPEYAAWDYQSVLAERLDTLDARVKAFDTTDAKDDPESVWSADFQCSICHRK